MGEKRTHRPLDEDIYREYLVQVNLLDWRGALHREEVRQKRRAKKRRYVRRLLWIVGLATVLCLLSR